MTLSEFKSWFEGFTENLVGPPDAKQWKRIQARVKEISGYPITERVFVDRYRDTFRPYLSWNVGGTPADQTVLLSGGNVASAGVKIEGKTVEQDPHNALRMAGSLEARELS